MRKEESEENIMKTKKMKMLSAIMAMVIALTAVFSVSFNAYATETTTNSTTTTVPTTTKPIAPKVPSVTGLRKNSSELNRLTIVWNKVRGASSYIVYGRNADTKSRYKLLGEVKSNTFTWKNIPSTTRYHFVVRTVMVKNGKRYYSENATLQTATSTALVSGVKLVDARKGISIKWNKQNKVTGYMVYRASAKSNGAYVLYRTIKGRNITSYTDNNVQPGKLYYYRVKAYRTYGGIGTFSSRLSNSKVFTTPGLDAVKTTASSQLYRIKLSWSKNSAASKYNVYYSSSRNGRYTRLVTTSGTSFTTKKLTNGRTYYFKVLPIKTVGDTTFTSPRTYIVSKKVTNKIFGKSVGESYIEISIKNQHMWMYKNGKFVTETDVVTGNDDGKHNTPKGVYYMMCHDSPSRLVGETWDVEVKYWMQFTSDGCGIHDSTWRADWEYGGTTYKGNGSHGCVNTPLSKVAKIFDNSYVGYPVIVRD